MLDTEIAAALLAAFTSIAIALFSAVKSLRTARESREHGTRHDKALAQLNSQLRLGEEEAVARLKAEMDRNFEVARRRLDADAVLAKYSEPLGVAAFDLQLRLRNILEDRYLETYVARLPERRQEALDSTLYRIAQYFGWMEVLRRGIQHLNFEEPDTFRRVAELRGKIIREWATDDYGLGFMIWADAQRAIGELMIVDTASGPSVMGFSAFSRSMDRFLPWLGHVRDSLEAISPARSARLVEVQHRLIDLIQILDDDKLRFPPDKLRLAILPKD